MILGLEIGIKIETEKNPFGNCSQSPCIHINSIIVFQISLSNEKHAHEIFFSSQIGFMNVNCVKSFFLKAN